MLGALKHTRWRVVRSYYTILSAQQYVISDRARDRKSWKNTPFKHGLSFFSLSFGVNILHVQQPSHSFYFPFYLAYLRCSFPQEKNNKMMIITDNEASAMFATIFCCCFYEKGVIIEIGPSMKAVHFARKIWRLQMDAIGKVRDGWGIDW